MRHLSLFAVFALLASRTAPAAAAASNDDVLRLRAEADTELEARVLVDRMTVGLWTQGIAPRALRTALAAVQGATVDAGLVLDAPSDSSKTDEDAEWVAYLHFDAPVHVASADWSAGYWTVQIEKEDVQALLTSRVSTHKLALPGGIDTSAMRRAEAQLANLDIVAAKATYTALTEVYALAAWATLRLGDVALIEGDVAGACTFWQSVDTVSPGRVAGTLAGLRGRALRCRGANMPDWYTLLMRRGRDDLVGQRLRDDTRWALQWENDATALEAALAVGEASLTSPLFNQVWARLLRGSLPQTVVRLGERPDLSLWGHPEGVDLALTIGRAWCALEVPSSASLAVQRLPRKNWIALSPHGLRQLTTAVGTCTLAGGAAQGATADALALSQLANPATQLQAQLKNLDARLDTLQQVLTSEVLLAEETP